MTAVLGFSPAVISCLVTILGTLFRARSAASVVLGLSVLVFAGFKVIIIIFVLGSVVDLEAIDLGLDWIMMGSCCCGYLLTDLTAMSAILVISIPVSLIIASITPSSYSHSHSHSSVTMFASPHSTHVFLHPCPLIIVEVSLFSSIDRYFLC